MGKKIADLIRSSSGHWSYISSSEYSYMGVGVEYREGTEYGWYCCVMVGSVNYGYLNMEEIRLLFFWTGAFFYNYPEKG